MNILLNNKAYSLIEVIISIGIITLGIITGIVLTVSNINVIKESNLRLIALNLAREGIEVIRNTRDSNWFQKKTFDEYLPISSDNRTLIITVYSEGAEGADYQKQNILDFTPQNIGEYNTNIFLEDERYTQYKVGFPIPESAEKTKYQRLITINDICKDLSECDNGICYTSDKCTEKIGIYVISEVRYTEKQRQYSVKQEVKLYDWK